jgi:hypothetical protein
VEGFGRNTLERKQQNNKFTQHRERASTIDGVYLSTSLLPHDTSAEIMAATFTNRNEAAVHLAPQTPNIGLSNG